MDLMIIFKILITDFIFPGLREFASCIFIFCFITKVEAQCTSDTRPLVLSSSNTIQYFSSPAYPADYPPNSDCAWHIQAPNVYDKIILNVELFRTQQDEFLKIYDGDSANGTLLAEIDDTNQKQFNAFVSPRDQLFFIFQSDGANEANGFNILFFSNQSANQHACGETITVSAGPQIFMSPNLPNQFTADDGCNWLFTSISGVITFQIFFMDMAACQPEFLSFYDGTTSGSNLLVQECDTAYVYEFPAINTTGSNAYVEWTVSESAIGYGFMFAFMQIDGSASSDTTTVAADTTTVALDATTVAAEKTTVASDTTTVAMDTTTVAAKKTTIAADTTTMAADTTTVAADTTTVAVDTTVAANKTTVAVDTTPVAADTTTVAADTTTAAADTTIAADTTTVAVGTTTVPADSTKTAADLTTLTADMTTVAEDTTTVSVDTTIAAKKSTVAADTTTVAADTTTFAVDTTASQDMIGIYLQYPLPDETVEFSISEDQSTGYVNKSVAVIILTTTGELDLNIVPRYETTTDQQIDMANDVKVFSFTEQDAPYYYLYLGKSLDFEKINKFSLLVTLGDTNITSMSYTVTFNITITDVNDVAPVILNLPENVTLSRNEIKGHHIFTLNATDGDVEVENQVISYRIVSGNQDGFFSVDNASGEVSLIKDASQMSTKIDEYSLNISAYSGDISLENSGILTVYVPNNAPNCTHDTAWAYSLDISTATTGTKISFLDTWSCSDAGDTITYSIISVSPNLTSAFTIDTSTGAVSLLRTIYSTEVPNRKFVLNISVKDQVDQTASFSIYMNVTTVSCLPNPRNLYVRMDQELGGVILDNFNCTVTSGLTFSMTQYPVGTFDINEKSQLILTASVFKIKFYSLSITVTRGSEEILLQFNVIIQTRRCGVSRGISYHLQSNTNIIILFVLPWTILWKSLFV